MGIAQGKQEKISPKINNNKKVVFDPTEPEPALTKIEEEMLKEMWISLKDVIAKVGVITFINLFETHPEVQDAFMSFRTLEQDDMEFNAILRKHSLRVMGTVDKCIARLNHREKLRELMMELGIRHKNYTVKMEYIELMGPQFIMSIKPHLSDVWTAEHERAWEALFDVMCHHMKKGMCSI